MRRNKSNSWSKWEE